MFCGFFHVTLLEVQPRDGPSAEGEGNDNEGARYLYRSLSFDQCVRPGCAAQGQQQTGDAGQAERTNGLQTPGQGRGH
jgi:hypothetical protein